MTHPWQMYWFSDFLKKEYPQCFKNVRVLDVGSLDINGNNRIYFEDSDYVGLDVIEGPNVDVVCPCHEYKTDKLFDVIISTSALEHDKHIEQTLRTMYLLLKPGGYIFISAANGWPEHGTKNSTPENSGTSMIDDKEWNEYYKNVSWSDIRNGFDLEERPIRWKNRVKNKQMLESESEKFEYYMIETSKRDIRFIGKKR